VNSAAYESYCKFISSLFHEHDTVCFAVFTRETKTHVFLPFEQALSTDHFKKLEESNAAGADIYFGLNPFDPSLIGQSQGRTEANISRVARLYVDIDANGPETLARIKSGDKIPQPHSILSTSPNKYQLIWNVSGLDKQTAKQHLAALIQQFGTDAACKDLNRIFRLPGFKNHKYSDKPIVQQLGMSAAPKAFTAEDFKLPLEEARTLETSTLPSDVEATEIRKRADLVRSNLKHVGIAFSETSQVHPKPAIRFDIQCPWRAEHSPGIDKAAIFAYPDGFGFHCFHAHCSQRSWQTFRPYIDGVARERGVSLNWGSNPDAMAEASSKPITVEMLDREFPRWSGETAEEGQWLVEGLLEKGLSFFASLAGVGKSWAALELAKALSTGMPLFGVFAIPEKASVLYLAPEVSAGSFTRRIKRLGFPKDSNRFRFRTISEGKKLFLRDPKVIGAVEALRKDGPVVVIADTLVRFTQSQDENSASQNRGLADDALALVGLGADLLFLHHSPKAFGTAKIPTLENVLRGTGDFGALANSVIAFRRDQSLYKGGAGPTEVEVFSLKPRECANAATTFRLAFTRAAGVGENDGRPVSLIGEIGSLQYIGPPVKPQEIEADLDELLVKHPEWTREECADALEISVKKFDQLAKDAEWEIRLVDDYDANGNKKLNSRRGPLKKRRWVKRSDDFAVRALSVEMTADAC
jgi:hypothetical protein